MRYRRARTPGGTFFFTLNLADRSSHLLVDRIDMLRHAVRATLRGHPLTAVAWAVMPDHMHAIWTLPEGDSDYSTRWMLIKQRFSRAMQPDEAIGSSRRKKSERCIWQRRYWEHEIRSQRDLTRHIDYVHINPVKHGYTARASDWPYSSIHRYIRQGVLTEDWACDPTHFPGGERSS
ncbi:REP-associated tyrosine transposase [Dyella sp. 2RAB6]|uniref:REP-associated tyrosine transposase n=1 Tax=Dyella sp. 2RAB6 TaxID=3232992 RepID=UPI003F91861B